MAWERRSNIGRYLRILCLKSTSKKNRRKNRIIRIFCELLAKMRLGSLINRGFLEGTVEMIEARRRALTHFAFIAQPFSLFVEMIEARRRALTLFFNISSRFLAPSRNDRSPKKGIDTIASFLQKSHQNTVEMIEARRRALTHLHATAKNISERRRNDRSPKKGIDTLTGSTFSTGVSS